MKSFHTILLIDQCNDSVQFSLFDSHHLPSVFQGATCGFGLTYRNVTCVRGDNKKPVEHWLCPTASKPTTSDICNVPCETDCQLSEWSHWSHCHGDCTKDKVGKTIYWLLDQRSLLKICLKFHHFNWGSLKSRVYTIQVGRYKKVFKKKKKIGSIDPFVKYR